MTATSELLQAALRYLPRTIPLVARDKRPNVGEGWPQWTATRETVTAHYTQHPDDNIGIRTGNGLAVLDIDVWDGGDVGLAELEREHGTLPPTVTVVTGSGGLHKFYRGPRNLQSRNLRTIGINGIEIKADGCQVVAPPSIHPDTEKLYVWHPNHPLIERDIAPLPDWIAALAAVQTNHGPNNVNDLAERDPLHRIPSNVYVEKLTGRTINRGGYIRCPFHGDGREWQPSLKVYPGGGWKCFGCDVGGRIYQLAGLLGGWTLPLTRADRLEVRVVLQRIFAAELAA